MMPHELPKWLSSRYRPDRTVTLIEINLLKRPPLGRLAPRCQAAVGGGWGEIILNTAWLLRRTDVQFITKRRHNTHSCTSRLSSERLQCVEHLRQILLRMKIQLDRKTAAAKWKTD